MAISSKRRKLFEIGNLIAQHSGGRATLYREKNETSDFSHFIKVDGRKIGYDIEHYGSIGDGKIGWEQVLPMFLAEVLKPLKFLGLLVSYNVAGEELKRLGQEVYVEEVYSHWEALF